MRPNQAYSIYLAHIFEAIERAQRFLGGMPFEQFTLDEPISHATVRWTCSHDRGSPALSMKTSFSPQPLATVAGEYPRSWGQEAEIINFAGAPPQALARFAFMSCPIVCRSGM